MEQKQLAEELQKLEDKEGRITAKAVVDAARAPRHPLHDLFTWDDKKAGEQYRLMEARTLIRAVKVERINLDFRAPFYVRDVTVPAAQQGYRRLSEISQDVEDSKATLAMEAERAIALLRRAREIAAVLNLGDELERAIGQVARFKDLLTTSAS
jgi:hypothetical protein